MRRRQLLASSACLLGLGGLQFAIGRALTAAHQQVAILLGFQHPEPIGERRAGLTLAERMNALDVAGKLRAHGYPAAAVDKVLGENFHRVLGEIWGTA